MSSVDRKTFRFFLENAGYASPPGRAACALDLARAEVLLQRAVDLGLARVDWTEEEGWSWGDLGDVFNEDAMRAKFDSNEWTGPYCAAIHLGAERYAASLGMIVLGQWGTGDPYARVVAAELACELADDLRQAIGDALDAQDSSTGSEVHG